MSVAERATAKRFKDEVENFERGIRNSLLSLKRIHDDKLYVAEFTTFEECCSKLWGMTRQRAHQLLSAANVRSGILLALGDREMSTMVDKNTPDSQNNTLKVVEGELDWEFDEDDVPSSERQLREIAKAPHDKRVEVVKEVSKKAKESGKKPTAADYKEAVEKVVAEETEQPKNKGEIAVANAGKAKSLQLALSRCKTMLNELVDEQIEGLEYLATRRQAIEGHIQNAWSEVWRCVPVAVCSTCKGEGLIGGNSACFNCGNMGWVNSEGASQHKSLAKAKESVA